ncbi:ATP-binding protein [Longimicrobium sp.]|uniref:ATP-binding protein n=1 Tax=Longimicrobium sp. TaxID=2029185 RepID=UPI002E2F3063|nr:ATP-binding protein [Longimicrobium sp.]HEX6037689.1 ATP-binding protein [Longimicrobium sp.]
MTPPFHSGTPRPGLPAERPPTDAEQAEDVRLFRSVSLFTALIVTVIMPVIAVIQPDSAWRAARVMVVVDATVLFTLWLAGRGRVRLASWIYLWAIIALLTFNALTAGGIRSTGVQAYGVFVMVAGLLLGMRAGVVMTGVCAALGLALVVAERMGLPLPRDTDSYDVASRWLMSCVFIAVSLQTLHIATGRLRRALDAARGELAMRRAAELRLERALDAGGIGIFEHVPGSDRVRLDGRALALTGITAEPDGEVRIETWLRHVHPQDRARVLDDLALSPRDRTHGRTHYRVVRPDGALRHVEAAAHRVEGAEGQPPATFGMVMDVTERKQGEAERERLVQRLGERVKELRLLHEAAHLLQHAGGVDRLLLAELVARMPAAWFHADDACARIACGDLEATSPGWSATPWMQTAGFSASNGPGVLQVAYRHEHPAADEGPFLREERALIDSLAEMLRSHVERYVVEQRRQAVEDQLRQAQKMDALGTLAGGVAHDFNNILAAIHGYAELALLDAPPDSELRQGVDEILKACARARDLVRRILLFSRGQQSRRDAMPLGPVVDEALQLLRATLPPNIEIRSHAAPRLPLVRADATQMHQVVMNLGTNAAYAMREDGGTLSVELGAVDVEAAAAGFSAELKPGRYLRLRVTDTGCGMRPEIRERLFEPFFTTKGQAGTGLGLSVVHGIVRDHGGTISVASQPGEGSRFDIHLPAAPNAAVPRADDRAQGPRGAGQHVMYVDDEPALCHIMTRILVHLGYRCTAFTDPVAALQEFRTAPQAFDAVVTDLQMPAMSGLDLARAVWSVRPGVAVAVASGLPPDHIATDPDVDSVAWIQKPPAIDDLATRLHRLVPGGGSTT